MATLDNIAHVQPPKTAGDPQSDTVSRELNCRGFPYGAPPCRIYRPSPSAMQSGRAQSRTWVLEFEPFGHRRTEPLMGWTSSDNPFAPIRLRFPTLAAAVAYAERQGLDYRASTAPAPREISGNYPRPCRCGVTLRGSRKAFSWARMPASQSRHLTQWRYRHG